MSFALIGVGWPEGEVFAFLRPLYDSDTFPDSELRAIIEGARKRNPQPTQRRRDWHSGSCRRAIPALSIDLRKPSKPLELHAPTSKELRAISEARCIGLGGVRLCASRGLLWCGSVCGYPSWVVADATRRVMQARRLDGKPFPRTGALGERKTHNLAGTSTRHPVGLQEAKGAQAILLVEGSADLVAAHHFIYAEEREADASAVAMLGAGLSIPKEDLASFARRHVRIIPHIDAAGSAACERWAGQLASVGARVDAFDLTELRRDDGETVNDLNDLIRIHPDDFKAHRAVWSLIP